MTKVAIVSGLRTPFAKQSTAFATLSALDLGRIVVSELLERSDIAPKEVARIVYGQVLPSLSAPNIAREVVLGVAMPRQTDAYSVSRACATSYQSTISIAESIMSGDIDCGISGGADSASDIPMAASKKFASVLLKASKSKSAIERVKTLSALRPKDLVPSPPALKEPSTRLTMGQSAEKMAKENHISRLAQDEFAHRSHTLAAKAWADGNFAQEVMPVYTGRDFSRVVSEDNLVRQDSQLENYTKLKPVFDRKHGTVTAGNSSPLTDGASALLLMSEAKAKGLGLKPLGYIRSYAFVAVDPFWQLLMGPSLATPLALDRAGLALKDMDLIDMHEAFSAQILSNVQAFESKRFAEEKLNRNAAIGQIDWDKFNVNGGSIAIGHPFAATGARQIIQTLNELTRRQGQFALCTACAAGGLGAAMVLEAA
ncbi:MAG: acetyl-CoA C-acyltransferase FadI [Myxococcales bacterium]|nr:acetyl-CoA C-acyltransferase FadI [Myxococcales bacterium]MCB9708891.1 acetyl-CoA C-acyltransferase FadI [Myxococcales bacterium]